MKIMRVFLLFTVLLGGTALALPKLQLDIEGGVYDPSDETTIIDELSFNLQLLVKQDVDLSNPLYVSAAVEGFPVGGLSIGGTSFSESDFLYGTPPAIEEYKDLGPHDIFPGYYVEYEVNTGILPDLQPLWNADPAANDDPGEMGYVFVLPVEVSEPTHFDAYSILSNKKTLFAPFSHDAAGGTPPPTAVPEPGILMLLGAGFLTMGIAAGRRRKQG